MFFSTGNFFSFGSASPQNSFSGTVFPSFIFSFSFTSKFLYEPPFFRLHFVLFTGCSRAKRVFFGKFVAWPVFQAQRDHRHIVVHWFYMVIRVRIISFSYLWLELNTIPYHARRFRKSVVHQREFVPHFLHEKAYDMVQHNINFKCRFVISRWNRRMEPKNQVFRMVQKAANIDMS